MPPDRPAAHLLLPGPLRQNTGGYHYDRRIIEGLRQHGWRIDVHELDPGFPQPDTAALAEAAATLASLPDDACVIVDGLALGAMPEAAEAQAARLRLVALVHHPLALETGLDPATARRLRDSEWRALACVRTIITTSPSTASALRRDGFANTPVRTVAPGVDIPVLDAGPGQAAAARPAALRLLCVATLTRRKGHDVLIDALQPLAGRDWQLVCVGSDQRDRTWADSLRQRIDQAGLVNRIVLTGEIDAARLDRYYRQADVFVLASHYEGYGMVFDEAIAYGLPIVATCAGAIVDTVPADAGLLVPAADPTALRTALTRLLDADEPLATLRSAAWQARDELRSWDQASAEFAGYLKSVAETDR